MQHDNFDEEDSLHRIEQGDEVAARELLRHFHPFVLKLVRAHLPRRISEEDLVQMIFIKVFHKLNQYTGRMPLEHWISRIAVNTCLNALKAEKIRPDGGSAISAKKSPPESRSLLPPRWIMRPLTISILPKNW